jgi:putative DNA primase/helicase
LRHSKTKEEIVAALLNRNNAISAHIYDQNNPAEYARKQVEKAIAQAPNIDADIKRLARLTAIQYEQQGKVAAERLGIRASILDRLVQGERADDTSKQGKGIAFKAPEPWPDEVDGAALLSAIADAIQTYIILSDHACVASSLWVLHTHLLDCFMVSPRLAVDSPTKGCGKTTFLDVLSRLVLKPLPTANVTPSVVFRVVEAQRPTLLIDEGDSFLRDNDELRGVLNSGHRKGGGVLRSVGDEHEPRWFATYSACAIALIGRLPETLHDRSVVINLKRRLPNEVIRSFRSDKAEHLDVLARQVARWAKDNASKIAEADPAMSKGIYNRESDNWRGLIAIADAAGGEWPKLARKALEQCHAEADEEAELGMLLTDIKSIFTGRNTDRVPSHVIVMEISKGDLGLSIVMASPSLRTSLHVPSSRLASYRRPSVCPMTRHRRATTCTSLPMRSRVIC